MLKLRSVGAVIGFALLGVVCAAVPAFATADSAAVAATTAGGTDLKDTLVAIATAVLPFAAAILALVFGWKMVRKFVHA